MTIDTGKLVRDEVWSTVQYVSWDRSIGMLNNKVSNVLWDNLRIPWISRVRYTLMELIPD